MDVILKFDRQNNYNNFFIYFLFYCEIDNIQIIIFTKGINKNLNIEKYNRKSSEGKCILLDATKKNIPVI